MSAQISRWGNSLGVRIHRQIAESVGLTEGARVEIAADDGRVVITPAVRRYTIEELVSDMTIDNVRKAFDWGRDMGREEVL